MSYFSELSAAITQLLFPHVCDGCGSDLLSSHSSICMRCIESLPATGFENSADNPVEKRFYGRLPFVRATAQYYFTKGSLMAQLVHLVKYKGHYDLGLQLGNMMGIALQRSGEFQVDSIIPLPLFAARQKKRGYNQATLLSKGIAEYLKVPVMENVIMRPSSTETQTKKGRIERWENMAGKFLLANPAVIEGKHILLVDDVITTGATLESCGATLLEARGTNLSIACLCHSFS